MANNEELDRDAVTPLYVQIRDALVQRIEQGHFSEGKMLPSIRQLASEFGVAVFTVRQALDLLADDGIIGKQAGRGSFVVSGTKPQTQAKQRRAAILFLAADGNPEWEQYSFPIKHEMEYAFDQAGFRLLYGPVHPELLEGFFEENIEDASGIILWSHYERVKKLLTRYELPVVLYGWDPDLVDRKYVKDVVNFDGYDGIVEMVNHLAGLGHSKIATIHATTEDFPGVRRLQAFKDAIAAAGLPLNPDYIVAGHYMIADGRQAMRQLLALKDRPTAVVCHNDYMALGAMAEIASAGLRIPEDISVTGLDDVEAGAHAHPPLTTARIDRAFLGAALARLMIERLANPRKPFTVANIDAQIQIRKSCRSPQLVIETGNKVEKNSTVRVG